MKLKLILCMVLFTVLTMVKAQNREFYGRSFEIGVNATNILSNLLSLNQNTEATSPYAVVFRKHLNSSTLRLDINGNYNTKNDFDVNGIFRELKNSQTEVRFGFEKLIVLNKRFGFGYGLDVLGSFTSSNSLVNGFFINSKDIGFGIGPAMRINFKLSERIVLSTESTLYGRVIFTDSNNNVGFPTQNFEYTNYSVKLNSPQSLFLTILL